MYILKNAFKNLGRNKGRNILLGMIVFALILSTTIALIINATTKEIIDDYQTRFGSIVTLSVDFDKLMAETEPGTDGAIGFPEAPAISAEQYLAFSDSNHLKSYQMDMLAGVIFNDLKAVDDKENEGMVGSIGGGNDNYISPKAKLLGYSDKKSIPDFVDGLRKVISGDFYKDKNDCLISSDFADLNALKVGDTFNIKETMDMEEVTLSVRGIYADATKAKGDLPPGAMSLEGAYGNRRNEILVDIDTMKEHFNVRNLTVNAEYELKSPDLVKDFEEELRSKGLDAAYNVETDEASYQKIVAPVVGLSKIALTFMFVILIVGAIILLFITSMVIRERKYEIGVLRAMGMKKHKVAYMLISEIVMITSICLGIGLSAGNLLSQPVADALIQGQVEAVEENQQNEVQYQNGAVYMAGDESDVKPLTTIEINVSSDAVVQIIFVALLLAFISSFAGVVFITKYEPMKILAERN